MEGNSALDDAAFITQAAFARRRGVTRKTVTVWKNRRYVVLRGKLVDVAATEARLTERLSVLRCSRCAAMWTNLLTLRAELEAALAASIGAERAQIGGSNS